VDFDSSGVGVVVVVVVVDVVVDVVVEPCLKLEFI